MPPGELLTRWTVRIALALYVTSLLLRAGKPANRSRLLAARLAWTAGCALFLLHVACAFHFYHEWSHLVAYEATAKRTAELTGLDSGAGLYANYAFAAVWTADVIWWWARPERYQTRPKLVSWSIQAFLAFIAFNATVVFGTGPIRWFGVGASAVLAATWLARAVWPD